MNVFSNKENIVRNITGKIKKKSMKGLNKNITNEKNLKYIVYCTTNLVNYKKYIGSHVCKDLTDGYLGSGTSLIQAFKKYGKQNFKREILAIVDCPKIMKELEEYYIDYYNAFTSKLFYNRNRKGVGYPYGRKKPKEHCENLRNQRLGKPNGLKGRVSPMKGKIHTSESKEKARLNNLGKNNKVILQFDLSGNFIKEWESQTIAAQSLGKKTGAAIGECAKGKRPTIYGYKWKYKEN
jgi:group I intron endonuclease